jgi:hypothetical protein
VVRVTKYLIEPDLVSKISWTLILGTVLFADRGQLSDILATLFRRQICLFWTDDRSGCSSLVDGLEGHKRFPLDQGLCQVANTKSMISLLQPPVLMFLTSLMSSHLCNQQLQDLGRHYQMPNIQDSLAIWEICKYSININYVSLESRRSARRSC